LTLRAPRVLSETPRMLSWTRFRLRSIELRRPSRFARSAVLLRRRHFAFRSHHGDDRVGAVFYEIRIMPQLFIAARLRDGVAVCLHQREVTLQGLGGIGDGLLERIAGRNAAGHVG